MKLPFFQFYPSDYMRDTRALSLAAKGGWVDILCLLHGSSTRGIVTLALVSWARVMGATVDQAGAVIGELDVLKVAEVKREVNGDVTISSRRMLRDDITREQTRLRVRRHREKAGGNADDTGRNANVTRKKSETRNQKPEDPDRTAGAVLSAEPAKPDSARGMAAVVAELPLGPVASNPETDPVAMTFPATGPLAEWPLRASKIAEWRVAFPGVNVEVVLRELRQWCVDNPKRRKTAGGMLRFLSGRLAARQDRAGGDDGKQRGRRMSFA